MQSISRRGFVISAATAAAAFGLDKPLEFMGTAFAQAGPARVIKFKVGDMEVIQLHDGVWEKAHDPGFVKNAPLDDVKAALKAGGLTDAHVPIPYTVTAVRRGGELVLFDSGTGGQVVPDRRPSSLATTCGRRPASTRPRSRPSSSRISMPTTSPA